MTARTHVHAFPPHESPLHWPIARFFAKVGATVAVIFDVWAEAHKQAVRAQDRFPFSVE